MPAARFRPTVAWKSCDRGLRCEELRCEGTAAAPMRTCTGRLMVSSSSSASSATGQGAYVSVSPWPSACSGWSGRNEDSVLFHSRGIQRPYAKPRTCTCIGQLAELSGCRAYHSLQRLLTGKEASAVRKIAGQELVNMRRSLPVHWSDGFLRKGACV